MLLQMYNKKAFTLMELVAVVIIISIIAAFAIPNYRRSIEYAHARDMTTNLMLIHAANRIIRSETGKFWPLDNGHDVAEINANLGLSIIESGVRYNCNAGAVVGDEYICTGTRNPGGGTVTSNFTVTITEVPIELSTLPLNPECTINGGAWGCPPP